MKKWLIILSLLFITCENKGGEMVREPAVAGQFYPGNPSDLEGMIQHFLDNSKIETGGTVIGLICPHAGYPYSGFTAAHGYKLLQGKDIKTVVIIGPSHHAYFDGISVYPSGKWKTPLGEVPIDEEIVKKLEKENPKIDYFPEAHTHEHSVEVQVPFLQVVLKEFKIVPIVMGAQTEENIDILANALYKVLKGRDDVVLIASSDLYHGYSYQQAKDMDSVVIDYIKKYNPDGLFQFIEEMERQRIAVACGGGPVAAVMKAAKMLGAEKSVILHTTTSADVVGNYSGYVVGYVSAALIKGNEKEEGIEDSEVEKPFDLTKEQKKTLLNIARKTLEEYLKTGNIPEFHIDDPELKKNMGVFVTLKKHGQLRGCIGLIRGIKPLYLGVQEMAISAATRDPRFPPVKYDELKDIEIEISVLTPFQRVKKPEEIKIGRDGLYIVKGFYSGLLLPQVPVEWGWDRETFLRQVCYKAGLPGDAWRDAELYKFQALVFSEE